MKRAHLRRILGATLIIGASLLIFTRGPRPEPTIPDGTLVIDGVVKRGMLTASPVGDPFLYANIRVTQERANADGKLGEVRLWAGRAGSRYVRVERDGTRAVDNYILPERSSSYRTAPEVQRLETLEDVPILENIPGWGDAEGGFTVSMWAVRPGDHVVLSQERRGLVEEVWVGDRMQIEADAAQTDDRRALQLWLGVILAIAGALLAAT